MGVNEAAWKTTRTSSRGPTLGSTLPLTLGLVSVLNKDLAHEGAQAVAIIFWYSYRCWKSNNMYSVPWDKYLQKGTPNAVPILLFNSLTLSADSQPQRRLV